MPNLDLWTRYKTNPESLVDEVFNIMNDLGGKLRARCS
jgi:hypothetical protein